MPGRKTKLFGDWREFTREFVIIVLGVLAALLAQSAVEALSWRAKVQAAMQDMDQELSTGNGPQAYVRLSIHRCLADRLHRLRDLIESGDRAAVVTAIEGVQLPLRNYNDAAREAANSADITAHMPADRKYGYRIVYALTPEMDSLHQKELADLADLRSLPRSGGAMDPEEKRAMLAAVENLRFDNDRMKRAAIFTLRRMGDIGIGLDKSQVARNFADLTVYRECLTTNVAPMLRFTPLAGGGPQD